MWLCGCVCLQALNRVVLVGLFFLFCWIKAELFLCIWAQFPVEGTADFSSKMGLGKISQIK